MLANQILKRPINTLLKQQTRLLITRRIFLLFNHSVETIYLATIVYVLGSTYSLVIGRPSETCMSKEGN